MSNKKRIKRNNLEIILIITGTFILLFATSFLFDINLVSSSIPRLIITIMLMVLELLIGILLLKNSVMN